MKDQIAHLSKHVFDVGLVKACRCLGAPIITMVYSAFQSIHGVQFILFAGVFFSITSVVASLFLNKVPFQEDLARGRLGPGQIPLQASP